MKKLIIALLLGSQLFALGDKTPSNNCKIVYGNIAAPKDVISTNFYSYDEYKMYKDEKGQLQFKNFSDQTQDFLKKVKAAAQEDCSEVGASVINIVDLKHQVDKDMFYFSTAINYIK